MINWDDIDTIFLDMDGTLLDLHFDNHFWLEHVPLRFSEKNRISIPEAKAELFPKMHALRGKLDWYCTDFWTQELKLPIIALKQEVSHLIKLRNNALGFLTFLRKQNKKVVLFSNAHEQTIALKMDKTGIADAFDQRVSAHQLGLPKEADGAWEKLLHHCPFNADKTLFIDDNFTVLDCANNFGIKHLLGIQQPDSKGALLEHQHYTLLRSFKQLMPDAL